MQAEPSIQSAVELLPGARPRRERLALPGGYQTPLFVHKIGQSPRATPVVHVHGIQSHPGWFFGSTAWLARNGWRVYQPVRRGSGDNAESRGHADSASQLLDDLDTACETAMEQAGADKVHLIGVSWGGKLAAAYAADGRLGRKVASAVLVAPGICAKVDVPAGRKVLIAASLLLYPRRQFEIPLNDVSMFTDNEVMRQYMLDDSARLLSATASFMYVSRQLDRTLARAGRGALAAPATLILASRDRIIDNDSTRAEVERLTGGRATAVELQGAHTLDFEPDPMPLYSELAAGLERGENR